MDEIRVPYGLSLIHISEPTRPLDDVRVWRGAKLDAPAVPLKTGSLFGGWYKDEACTEPWNFEEDTVDKNMTLYARWN